MSEDDAARFRKDAEECRQLAAKAINPLDKEERLRTAEEWIKLAMSVEERGDQEWSLWAGHDSRKPLLMLPYSSCAARLESVCHSMAISAHATFMAGSVASSARRSQVNALSRYLSERLLFISTLRWWVEHQHSLSPVTATDTVMMQPTRGSRTTHRRILLVPLT
jgi:hypothetical protein